ncbi:PH domain-containing protein [Aliiglaciecola litoralis]|uniref:YdbS-like PH domain-containing protein n=1 Tax=Aliiglaciecola litoralis TaxID=582857 RepID=A0ABP3WRY4_9ALTE
MDKVPQEGEIQELDWQRLAPIAILYFAASNVKKLISNLIYLIPAFAISYSSIKDSPITWLVILAVVLGFFVVNAALEYLFFTFKLSSNNIEIRSGIIAKKYLNLPFSRIQNVTLEQPLYYRLHDLVCVILDTAGSSQQEAKIVALPHAFAKQLKQQVLAEKNSQSSNITGTRHNDNNESHLNLEQDQEQEVLLNQRSLSDLIIHGFTNNRVWIIIGFLAPLYDDIARYISSHLDSLGVEYQRYFDTQAQALWQLGLAFFAIVAGIFLLVTLVSIIGSIVIFYDFTLSKINGRYVRRSGLFTKQETTMRLSRIQVIALKQDWLDVLLKRVNLELKQSNSGTQAENQAQNSSKILVPSIRPDQALALLEDAFAINALRKVHFNAISRRFITRQCLVWLMPLTAIAATVAFNHFSLNALWLVVAVSLLLFIAVCCCWKRWGYAKDKDYIYIRKGIFGVDYYCFPIYKVQQTQYVQSYFMRRNGLANMHFVLASGSLSVPFVAQTTANIWLNETLSHVSEQRRSWM